MTGKELGFVESSVPSWKERLARITLSRYRAQGHTYVDLRKDGKGVVFFCTLCLTPCYSETVLNDHLGGNLHKERLPVAKKTLMGSNPWPFDDGVHFFSSSVEGEKDVGSQGSELAIVDACDVLTNGNDGHLNGNGNGKSGGDSYVCIDDVVRDGGDFDLVIPGVLGKDEVSDLRVRLMGYGHICARVLREQELNTCIYRLWCEWLGKRGGDDHIISSISSHNFAIVTFSYFYDLGKQGLFDVLRTYLLTNGEDDQNSNGSKNKRKRSFSYSEDGSETQNHQCGISREDSQGSSSATSSALLVHHSDDQLSRISSSKSLRRLVRKQQRVASEKMCDICQQRMLPGKDVAALLNVKTGKLACSSRNIHGAFHVFHTSCLIHWILLCEFEMFMKPPMRPKVRRSARKMKSGIRETGKEGEAKVNTAKHSQSFKADDAGTSGGRICSVFCPACQGTGVEVEGDELENPTISLSEMFKYKIKVSDAHRSWMASPEELDNCSTGFAFPISADNIEEMVIRMKLLHFYRADEDSWAQSS